MGSLQLIRSRLLSGVLVVSPCLSFQKMNAYSVQSVSKAVSFCGGREFEEGAGHLLDVELQQGR